MCGQYIEMTVPFKDGTESWCCTIFILYCRFYRFTAHALRRCRKIDSPIVDSFVSSKGEFKGPDGIQGRYYVGTFVYQTLDPNFICQQVKIICLLLFYRTSLLTLAMEIPSKPHRHVDRRRTTTTAKLVVQQAKQEFIKPMSQTPRPTTLMPGSPFFCYTTP